jgi:excisionase family DNA binding protein
LGSSGEDAARRREWLTLAEASTLLDVAPVTLRRWADAGSVPVFTTPGGHRRFSRTGLEQLLPQGSSPGARRAGGHGVPRPGPGEEGALATVTPARLRRSYREEAHRASAELAWLRHLSDQQMTWFRERGRRMAALLITQLDSPSPEAAAHALAEASAIAAEYGRMTGRVGLSMSQSVEGFLRFRRPFLHELSAAAQRRGFDAAGTGSLLEDAERSMDRLLVALLGAHGVTRVGELMGHDAPVVLSPGTRPEAPGRPSRSKLDATGRDPS